MHNFNDIQSFLLNNFNFDINYFSIPSALIFFDPTLSTYFYISVNNSFANIFNLQIDQFVNKEIGFLDNNSISDSNLLDGFFNSKSYQIINFKNEIKSFDNTYLFNFFYNDISNLFTSSDFLDLNKLKFYFLIGFPLSFLHLNNFSSTSVNLNLIIDNLPKIFLYWKDSKNKYLGSNHKLSNYLANHEPLDTTLLLNLNDPNYFKTVHDLLFDGKSILNIVESFLINDKKFIFRVSKIPLFYDNVILAFLYIYVDITQEISEFFYLKLELTNFKNLIQKLYSKGILIHKNPTTKEYEIKFETNSKLRMENNSIIFNESDTRKLIEIDHTISQLNTKVNSLYKKVFEDSNSIIRNLSVLDENQNQDKFNFLRIEKLVEENIEKLDKLENAIKFFTFIQNLTIKQILSFLLILSLLVSGLNYLKIDFKYLMKLKDNISKIID